MKTLLIASSIVLGTLNAYAADCNTSQKIKQVAQDRNVSSASTSAGVVCTVILTPAHGELDGCEPTSSYVYCEYKEKPLQKLKGVVTLPAGSTCTVNSATANQPIVTGQDENENDIYDTVPDRSADNQPCGA
jgi:hypothetical protein